MHWASTVTSRRAWYLSTERCQRASIDKMVPNDGRAMHLKCSQQRRAALYERACAGSERGGSFLALGVLCVCGTWAAGSSSLDSGHLQMQMHQLPALRQSRKEGTCETCGGTSCRPALLQHQAWSMMSICPFCLDPAWGPLHTITCYDGHVTHI